MNQIAQIEPTATAAVVSGGASSIGALMMNPAVLQQLDVMAERMATGRCTVPDHLRGSVGDCYAIVMQAIQWGMNPYAVAQKTHVVSGKLGYEAQLVNAVINSLAPTKDRLHYEWYGDWTKILGKTESISREGKTFRKPAWKPDDEVGLGVRCWATMKGEDEPRVLELLLTQALTRNSTLWADDPRQQLAYLATKRWSRLYCPDVILGVYTPDEFADVAPERDITPPQPPEQTRTATVREKMTRGRSARQSEPVPSPVVEGEVVDSITDDEAAATLVADINAAGTTDDLRQIGTRVNAFLSGDPKRKAFRASLMAAYTARGAALAEPAVQEPEAAAAPRVTYAEIADRLNKATTQDERDVAIDLIGEIASEEQRTELSTLYNKLSADQ